MKPLILAAAALLVAAPAAFAQDAPPAAPAPPAMDMSHMDMSHGMAMPGMVMTGALGPYGMVRDASGTSWQPDASVHEGLHLNEGGWMIMAHALINGVYDSQSGPRGGDKALVAGMIMAQASHPLTAADTLTLRTMLSPEPFMGPAGYPLLLQTGETANGKTPLIDRQHPHNLVMELAAVVNHRLDASSSLYLYAGLPGEPALGPPAFMHRLSGMDDPEAPITHHWLDSTHITNGVITGGVVLGDIKLEASSFHGREPDQHRFDIEPGALDSESVRASWNPTANWSLQASYGHLTGPEQLEPTVNEDRFTASAIYTLRVLEGWWSTTAAFGSKRESYGQTLNGWLLESALRPNDPWTIFTRIEGEQNNELLSLDMPAPAVPTPTTAYGVGEATVGVIHDWRVVPHIKLGLGGLYNWAFVPAPLRAAYGDDPHGSMVWVRLKVD